MSEEAAPIERGAIKLCPAWQLFIGLYDHTKVSIGGIWSEYTIGIG